MSVLTKGNAVLVAHPTSMICKKVLTVKRHRAESQTEERVSMGGAKMAGRTADISELQQDSELTVR
jgi:hypothetical protein